MKFNFIALSLSLLIFGCTEEADQHPCYDSRLVHDGACTTDCPGFVACNGETYCNQCEAARDGFGPQ